MGQLEAEIFGKFSGIALGGLIEAERRHAVEAGEVGVENHAVTADRKDAGRDGVGGLGHGGQRESWLRTAAALARTEET